MVSTASSGIERMSADAVEERDYAGHVRGGIDLVAAHMASARHIEGLDLGAVRRGNAIAIFNRHEIVVLAVDDQQGNAVRSQGGHVIDGPHGVQVPAYDRPSGEY